MKFIESFLIRIHWIGKRLSHIANARKSKVFRSLFLVLVPRKLYFKS